MLVVGKTGRKDAAVPLYPLPVEFRTCSHSKYFPDRSTTITRGRGGALPTSAPPLRRRHARGRPGTQHTKTETSSQELNRGIHLSATKIPTRARTYAGEYVRELATMNAMPARPPFTHPNSPSNQSLSRPSPIDLRSMMIPVQIDRRITRQGRGGGGTRWRSAPDGTAATPLRRRLTACRPHTGHC